MIHGTHLSLSLSSSFGQVPQPEDRAVARRERWIHAFGCRAHASPAPPRSLRILLEERGGEGWRDLCERAGAAHRWSRPPRAVGGREAEAARRGGGRSNKEATPGERPRQGGRQATENCRNGHGGRCRELGDGVRRELGEGVTVLPCKLAWRKLTHRWDGVRGVSPHSSTGTGSRGWIWVATPN